MTPLPGFVRVITWLPVGGIERRLVAVVPRLRDLGWRPRVLLIREEGALAGELRDAGIPVEVVRFDSRLSPFAIRRLAAAMRAHGTDVVHSHMYRANVPASFAGRLAGARAIFGQVHNVDTWENGRQALVDRVSARLRTGTIAVSRAVQEDVMRRLGLPAERVPILYNGVDLEAFRFDAAARERLRSELGAAPGRTVFLVPARLHPQKYPLPVLEAFAAEFGADAEPPMLAFAGGGKLEAELRERAAAFPWARVLGRRDDMAALYSAADAVLLSSAREGFSNAVVEALACGRPVIASDVGGNREAVDSESAGWIHEAADWRAMRAQLRAAATLGPGGLAAMSGACRARSQAFSIDALVQATDALYRGALKGGGAGSP